MKQPDDNHYIDLVLNGNTAAFTQLVNRHKQMAFSIALKILQNREEAEEVAQDAFVKAFQSLGQFGKKSKFSTWLYRIVYNTAISVSRKKSIPFLPLDEKQIEQYPQEEVCETINGLDQDEQKTLIESILVHLPQADQLLVHLYYFGGHSIEEIGSITALKESNIKVRLHRIRKKLYSLLSEQLVLQQV